MSSDNGRNRTPPEVLGTYLLQAPEAPREFPRAEPTQEPRPRAGGWLALFLLLITLLFTLAAGAQFALAYANNQAPFSGDFYPYPTLRAVVADPRLLLLGFPFSFTLLGILLAHELGHYFACRYYGISASYPYFIPAPTIIGTMGAFIRIRSPIVNRRALFDVGLAGPVVGFVFALPALALAIAYSKWVPAAQENSLIVFGNPPLASLLIAWLRPGIPPGEILLHPVGRAAWVGLFATALNLLPVGQLDGGHIVYALASEKHRRISLGVVLALVPLGFYWPGWLLWSVLLLLLGFRHPALRDRWEPLDRTRRAWAGIALLIFLLCFTPSPFSIR